MSVSECIIELNLQEMNASWLEQTRFELEGIETIQKAIVKLMAQKEETPKEGVIIDHKINILLGMVQHKSRQVKALLQDEDGVKKEELAIISGQKHFSGDSEKDKGKGSNQWDNFYGKLKEIKDTHRKFTPSVQLPTNTVDYFFKIVFSPPNKQPQFSAEESKGRYVDMHSLYVEHLNLYKVLSSDQKFDDYLKYLQNFDKFHSIPVPTKMKNYAKYHTYLTNLADYLNKYLQKVKPLLNTKSIVDQFAIDFETRFAKRQVPGWEDEEDLKDDKLVYCPDCQKVFVNESLYLSHLNGKKHINVAGTRELTKEQHDEEENRHKQEYRQEHSQKKKVLALLEYKIGRFREELATNVYDSMNLIRKKQTRGYEEKSEEEQESSQSEVDPDEPIYNPKNLPLGWDGKPIPYWLYKLHGLGIQYKCQICGNYSYWGRRAFEMHFQEWRHTYGMKCLKIPNTIHFKDVTKIEDAFALHNKLMSEVQSSQFQADVQQEFQDDEGNVINRKTYFDMKRQGLIN